jgi:site-specific DNA-methyltransferase (adenine-specific)
MIPEFEINGVRVFCGDALAVLRCLPDNFYQCVITSPPYWRLRDYGVEGQIGLEPTIAEYLACMVEIFREVRRVLRRDGVCWVNMGDGFSVCGNGEGSGKQITNKGVKHDPFRAPGLPPKCKILMPHRLAIAMIDDGWICRQDNVWEKPQVMPESVRDRTTSSHEYIFQFVKAGKYFYDADAIRELASPETNPRMARAFAGYNPPGQEPQSGIMKGRPGGKKPEQFDDLVTGAGRSGVGEVHIPKPDGALFERAPGVNPKAMLNGHSKIPASWQRKKPGRTEGVPGQPPNSAARGKNAQSQNRRKVGFNERWDAKEAQALAAKPESQESLLGEKNSEATDEVKSSAGARMGRGAGWRNKQNESFSAAVAGLVEYRNCRSVWTIPNTGFEGAHFATFPLEIPRRCILASTRPGDRVLDLFAGSGTTGEAAVILGRTCDLIELNPKYLKFIRQRIADAQPPLEEL